MSEPGHHDLDETLRLVRSAQAGDASALEGLFARYIPVVRQIVALRMGWRLRQMLDVEDLVQNALVRILRSLEKFEPRSEGSFRNWLARCVEREIVDTQRTETRAKRGGGAVARFGDCDASVLHSSIFGADDSTPAPASWPSVSRRPSSPCPRTSVSSSSCERSATCRTGKSPPSSAPPTRQACAWRAHGRSGSSTRACSHPASVSPYSRISVSKPLFACRHRLRSPWTVDRAP